jgi:uncharacterized ferritin-like protein (DUF455 family)
MGRFSEAPVNWAPFTVCAPGEKAPYPRSIQTLEGLGDRLRFVAFAELQAHHAFLIAANGFAGLSGQTRKMWLELASEEAKHLGWLLRRMEELGVDPAGRPQSLALWNSFDRCDTPEKFALFMANAEERGRIAGEQFEETLRKIDPVTAALFGRIAAEERHHIQLAEAAITGTPSGD